MIEYMRKREHWKVVLWKEKEYNRENEKKSAP